MWGVLGVLGVVVAACSDGWTVRVVRAVEGSEAGVEKPSEGLLVCAERSPPIWGSA